MSGKILKLHLARLFFICQIHVFFYLFLNRDFLLVLLHLLNHDLFSFWACCLNVSPQVFARVLSCPIFFSGVISLLWILCHLIKFFIILFLNEDWVHACGLLLRSTAERPPDNANSASPIISRPLFQSRNLDIIFNLLSSSFIFQFCAFVNL